MDGLDLGGQEYCVGRPVAIEGLYPEAIARAEDRGGSPVVDQKGPHPIEPRHAVATPLPVRGQQHLRVSARREDVPETHQLLAELDVVIDLAVEDEDYLTI